MKLRTIQHPGVEINEYDLSTRPSYDTGINGVVFGYTSKGPLYEYTKITSLTEFLNIYGEPQTEPEVYLYMAVQSIIANGGVPLVSRLPYANSQCKNYNCIQYQIVKNESTNSLDYPFLTNSGYHINYTNVWEIKYTKPLTSNSDEAGSNVIVSTITNDSYDILKTYGVIPNSEDSSADIDPLTDFIIVDKNKSISRGNTPYEKDENSGYLVGIIDINQAIMYQKVFDETYSLDPANTNSEADREKLKCEILTKIFNSNGYNIADVNTFSQPLSSESSGYSWGTVSEDFVRLWPQIPLVDNNDFTAVDDDTYTTIDKKYSNHVVIFVAKTSVNSSTGRIDVDGIESFFGSLYPEIDSVTGVSTYVGDLINNQSNYIEFYSRFTNDGEKTTNVGLLPNSFNKSSDVIVADSSLSVNKFISFAAKEVLKRIPQWNFKEQNLDEQNSSEDTETALTDAIKYLENIDDVTVHFVCEAGLGSIMSMLTQEGGANSTYGYYKPEKWVKNKKNLGPWFAVINKLNNLVASTRKDCFLVFDAPRGITLEGTQPIVRKSKKSNTFNGEILPWLSYCSGLNSSYAAGYFNWIQTTSPVTGSNMWVPTSVKIIGNYIYQTLYDTPWLPPAGSTYGTLTSVNAISHNPSPSDEDQIYLKHWNYIKNWPIDGFLVEGQKTTLTKNSALNRVNVRLTMLELERYVYQRSHYFKYQPNNQIVRDQFIETMKVKFADYMSRGGLYDYKIVADSSNNTAETIDNNELRAAFYCKPARSIEFILCDFIITKSDSDFTETY